MKIISFNANGIRACFRRGFFDWVKDQNADVICIQELKADIADCINLPGYNFAAHTALKKGYSGVGIYSLKEPCFIKTGLGFEIADTEGRYIEMQFGDLYIASVYLPSGTSGPDKQQNKEQFMDKYYSDHLMQLKDKQMIICGDWNIAHMPIDLKNWRANQNSTGFLPHERSWLSKCLNEANLIDAYRYLYPETAAYTWWTYRGRARINNVGWRIDYQMVTNNLKDKIKAAWIYNEQVFSDHAPLVVEYDL